ncbi:mago binding protein [Schizosaccharomyces cryophilus OY26]|uniref:Mago binding protein n=1 Tax=Schizosaccharomyces cryophilus (strain OY26 / ATCC MYA-4695 / CBS 11777 / NBRC 106824 / NRRL Y48691) TaxID=653667 RepID=S9X3D3_SCHCR|nr:mago binding protein [Schizosaccharomyces cryophilus OY26]EPY51617.1 mago binding protein [Schizosaccharomyces cryophilus OY26]
MEGKKSFSGARLVEGKFVIPESRRKDGSVRQQIQVRPGYVAPEDIPRYRPGGGRISFLEKQMQKLKLENESKADKGNHQKKETKFSKSLDEKRDEKTNKSTEKLAEIERIAGKDDTNAPKEGIPPRESATTNKDENQSFVPKSSKKPGGNSTPEWRRSARPFNQKTSEQPPKSRVADIASRNTKGKWKQSKVIHKATTDGGKSK